MRAAGAYAVCLRVPGWSKECRLTVNGSPADAEMRNGYACVRRAWREGDELELTLDMRVRLIRANPAVHEDCGRVAVNRGPLVYCAEEQDNGDCLKDIAIWRDQAFETAWDDQLRVMTVACDGLRSDWPEGVLYSDALCAEKAVRVRLIPYFAWANRGEGEMQVWLRERT